MPKPLVRRLATTLVLLLATVALTPGTAHADVGWSWYNPWYPWMAQCVQTNQVAGLTYEFDWDTSRSPAACDIQFGGDPVTLNWYYSERNGTVQLGSGSVAGLSFTLTVPRVADYSVNIEACDVHGSCRPILGLLELYEWEPNEPPVAAVTVNVTQGGSPLRVEFDASGSYDPEGGRLRYQWIFGDEAGGEGSYTNRATIGHSYRNPGRYTPTLLILDDYGNVTVWSGPTIHVVDRYTVTVRAWIPHDEVVDPENPVDGQAVNLRQYCPNRPFRQAYLTSRFAGDDHQAYQESVRGQVAMVFDWDGTAIQRVGDPVVKRPSTTRVAEYTDLDGRTVTCRQSATAEPVTSATVTADNALRISLSTKNPLTPPELTPPIDAILTAAFDGTDLSVTYTTDLFPSYGFEVKKNSLILGQHLTHDASCVPALGVTGAAQLGIRLNAVELGSPRVTHHTIDTTSRNRHNTAQPCFA
ncbi:PKD domain-containing protein [Polymorphospora rubra]|uniref:PKD domain-containing protein n=1 Tax=Polymorphospora rubra TaxID=338584 RepID=A0A810N1E8_9ACTN|nr:PKD domain-containing protein [Polymorphospora rubra]BCJ66700.1 hypothetical protein Prubr_37210 [Polymorphospora rubra]